MATNTKNVIVGAASLFTSVGNSSNTFNRPDTDSTTLGALFASGIPARQSLLASAGAANGGYREVGYTTSGLEISYEPSYGDVVVDQLLDSARIFKQSLKVTLKTELAEATLENLQFSWGQMDTYFASDTASTVTSVPSLTTNDAAIGSKDNPAATLNMAAGALGDSPVERVIVAIGQAPQQIGTSAIFADPNSTGGGSTVITPNVASSYTSIRRNKERVYVARRVVAIDTTMHSLKRDGATMFPVNFRCLPDSDYRYAGSEYGVVIDRVYSTN
jgi:hypothetical protein